jgi:flagellar hook-basal body complex protein FliE
MTANITAIQPIASAVRAYGASAANAAGGTDFGAMLSDAARSSMQTLRRSEVVSARAAAGTADVQELVQAATAAELTVQAVTQFRDKAVSAYMDVLRMAV